MALKAMLVLVGPRLLAAQSCPEPRTHIVVYAPMCPQGHMSQPLDASLFCGLSPAFSFCAQDKFFI